jgi:16S rRNA (adenine1518-N6/adenine1519-N6)-dimethyltransferase
VSPSRPRWGQNFLADGNIAHRIVDEAGIDGANVVEIGPGQGALTELLVPRVRSLVCLEIDPTLAAFNEARFSRDTHVAIVRTDALKYDWPPNPDGPLRVVSNLPYESGTAIVMDILERVPHVEAMTVMLQKEVAMRVAGRPGSKIWGRLGIMANMYADVEASIVVSPRSFKPAPKVYSQVVHLRPLGRSRYPLGRKKVLEDLLAAAFSGRRKMLRNNLGAFLSDRFGEGVDADVFAEAGVAPTDRPEVVGLPEWAAMSLAVSQRDDNAGQCEGDA